MLSTQLKTFGSLIDGIAKSFKLYQDLVKGKDVNACIEAIKAIQSACNKTSRIIEEKGYKPNEELSEIWLNAMELTAKAKLSRELSIYLIDKSRFWSNPQPWRDNPATLGLVPKLLYLEEECKMILMNLY